MNAALKASIRAVPEQTIRIVAGAVALASTAIALFIAGLIRPSFGVVLSYALIPFLLSFAAFALVAIVRLQVVGLLSGDVSNDVIPKRLQSWIRWWLLIRLGLLGSGILLIFGGLLAAIAQRSLVGIVLQAFVYVVWIRILLDAVFGALFNAGVISSRS